MARRIWAGLVFAVGLLWLVGGVFGYLEGHFRALLFVFLGIVLVRFGANLFRA